MVEEPWRFIAPFTEAGADNLTFHIETTDDPRALTDRIHALGCTACAALKPDGAVERLREAASHLDMVLVMAVFPGFGGHRFLPATLPRIERVHGWLRPGQRLEVDGGLDPGWARRAIMAGADTLVSGTAVFRAPGRDYETAIRAPGASLRRLTFGRRDARGRAIEASEGQPQL